MKKLLQVLIALFLAVFAIMIFAPKALAFCGFYVAKAETKLYNQASQVIIARDGDRTILTMANDYQGDVKDFALVVPVPVVLEQEQVQVGNPKIIERLDGFSAPRLVEYFDPNPCIPPAPMQLRRSSGGVRSSADNGAVNLGDSALGVTVESRFSVFQTAYEQEQKKVAFLEYAWDMGWCDPCAANPLTRQELGQAGVFWLDTNAANNVFISRFHVRYTRDTFPEDLMFQETGSRQNFQGRYVLRHPYTGEMNCPAADEYKRTLNQRFEQEAQTLAKLTGWQIGDIRRKMDIPGTKPSRWWRRIWN